MGLVWNVDLAFSLLRFLRDSSQILPGWLLLYIYLLSCNFSDACKTGCSFGVKWFRIRRPGSHFSSTPHLVSLIVRFYIDSKFYSSMISDERYIAELVFFARNKKRKTLSRCMLFTSDKQIICWYGTHLFGGAGVGVIVKCNYPPPLPDK